MGWNGSSAATGAATNKKIARLAREAEEAAEAAEAIKTREEACEVAVETVQMK